jgi:two-component system response regulator YesN
MNKVVLVDDEIFARQGLKNLIDWEQCGFQVCEEAENGEEALEIIRARNPELVITDIRMPVLDGLELVRAVRESGNHSVRFVIISGYNDFQYAQKAIRFGVQDYILKPIDEEELIATLRQVSEQIRKERVLRPNQDGVMSRNVFEQLLAGELSQEQKADIADLLQVDPEAELFYCIVEWNGCRPRDIGGEGGAELLHASLEAVSAACASGSRPFVYEHQYGVHGFLLDARVRKDASPFPDRLLSRLKSGSGQQANVYIGATVRGIGNAKESIRTATELMQYKYAFAGQRVFLYEEMKAETLRYMEINAAHYAQLLEHMEEHDPGMIRAAIDQIFNDFERYRYAPEAIKNSINRCVFGAIRSIQNMQGDENQLRSLNPMLEWSLAPLALADLKALLSEFMTESAELIATLRKKNASGDIAKIRTYIETHYHENISLKSIAAKFFINPVYLGQLFKKTYGMYFNDFLLQLRVRKAKELLRQTELRIYEIAEKVGFNNADYFVSQFEKVENKTPTEYRNSLLIK